MMNLGSISDQLPTYPNNIQGELRLILQTKDVFLVCYKHLEEYRRLVNEQNRLITKEFVQEQLQIGEDEITELKMELQDAESRLTARLKHNELLADHLASLGYASLESGASVRHVALCRSPQMRKSMLAQRQGGCLGGSRLSEARPPTHMIDNIALAIAEIHQEVRAKVKPLLDYYRDLFYLQLHFSLVLGQVCNYCMPLVTENIGLIDRIFFWSERPEFDLVRRAGDIGDRLKEIYTRAQTVLSVLSESVRFLQSKVELQKTLEQRFHERLDEQQKTKDKILREVHTTKQNMDLLEEENDRLVGSLVKVDPSFVDSRHFFELAEGGGLVGAKKAGTSKETGGHNAEENQEVNMFPRRDMTDTDLRGSARSIDANSQSCIGNASDEMNNNKALSLATEATNALMKVKGSVDKKKSRQDVNGVIREERTKSSHRNSAKKIEIPDLSSAISEPDQTKSEIIESKSRARSGSRPRSKSRKRESSREQVKKNSKKSGEKKISRRSTSMEKEPMEVKAKKHRSKSSVGIRRTRDAGRETPKMSRRSVTPEKSFTDERPSSTSKAAGDSELMPQNQSTLKSKLLGRTKDLFEAALHRNPKNNSTEQVSKTFDVMQSSASSGQIETDEMINDGVTSVSSFASLLVPDSPLGDPTLEAANSIIPARQLRTLEPKSKQRQSPFGKNRSKRKGKSHIVEYDTQQLPNLADEKLLIQLPSEQPNLSSIQSTSSRPRGGDDYGTLGDFLTGSRMSTLTSSRTNSSTNPSML